ncbi:MAG: hypothetical protein M3547_04710 [Acidobacteriota bacterium]|nr:hypothetical protein [Acidobacteriota bacterium]
MPTRRTILKAAGAISALASVPIPAQTRTPNPTPRPTPAPAKPPDLLAKIARERYGKFLAEDELPLLDEDMAGLERRSARLRGYKLANSEEPAVDFHAERG